MTRFEDRTPRRRRGLKRQRRNEFAGSVVRIYRETVKQVRKGVIHRVPAPMTEKIRTLLRGEPIEDLRGQPSTLTESARADLLKEFLANGGSLNPGGAKSSDLTT